MNEPTKCEVCNSPVRLEREKLQAEIERLREVIEYYADKSNWVTPSGKVGVTPIWADDYGNKAREALQKGKQE